VDSLLFGGEFAGALSTTTPIFTFVKADVAEPRAIKDALRGEWQKPVAIVHLAAIVGFPACQAVGKQCMAL